MQDTKQALLLKNREHDENKCCNKLKQLRDSQSQIWKNKCIIDFNPDHTNKGEQLCEIQLLVYLEAIEEPTIQRLATLVTWEKKIDGNSINQLMLDWWPYALCLCPWSV